MGLKAVGEQDFVIPKADASKDTSTVTSFVKGTVTPCISKSSDTSAHPIAYRVETKGSSANELRASAWEAAFQTEFGKNPLSNEDVSLMAAWRRVHGSQEWINGEAKECSADWREDDGTYISGIIKTTFLPQDCIELEWTSSANESPGRRLCASTFYWPMRDQPYDRDMAQMSVYFLAAAVKDRMAKEWPDVEVTVERTKVIN